MNQTMKTMDMKRINKELVKTFIQECKWDQYWETKFKENHIDWDDYFKYSGKTEETKILISHWKYNHNFKSGNQLHEQFIKTQEYEKNKKNTSKFSKSSDAYYWDEAEDSIWCD